MRFQFSVTVWYSFAFFITLILCTIYLKRPLNNPKLKTTTLSNYLRVGPVNLKHVTKSLSELGSTDMLNPYVILLNLIPKCGGEVLVLILQRLQGWKNFKHVRLKQDYKKKFLTRAQQEKVIRTVNGITGKHAVPLSFDRHMHFINFTSFGRQSPTFISLIREPLDLVLSRIKNKLNTSSILQCIQKMNGNCLNLDLHHFPVSYLCGYERQCRLPNSSWALKTAQTNVERHYPVLGILEEIKMTLSVMELKLPYFFKKLPNIDYDTFIEQYNLTKERKVNKDLEDYLRSKLAMEYKFYEWARNRLQTQFRTVSTNQFDKIAYQISIQNNEV
ncbi:hypothetical protein RI129_005693 [Pyrocoelia pectoralis]|uniref:Uronyl 2-sulfotransferase n=1 Tax=Pyrocoelia pectoralis TaxID=417401 RepID=A0AAN7ZMD9_9COLE